MFAHIWEAPSAADLDDDAGLPAVVWLDSFAVGETVEDRIRKCAPVSERDVSEVAQVIDGLVRLGRQVENAYAFETLMDCGINQYKVSVRF